MATLIAVDGHSLNYGLQKFAQSRSDERRNRFKIDHLRLAELLAHPETLDKVSLRFYTDDQKSDKDDGRPMGRINKFFSNKGFGFIIGTDSRSYFFHHNEIVNKKVLCEDNDNRYPHPSSNDFRDRIFNKIVTFNIVKNEDGRFKAEEVRLETNNKSLDRYYQLRREPFLRMLEESDYKLVRCRASKHGGKSKSIDCRIILDALSELEENDKFVLLSDDPIFIDLILKLKDKNIKVTVATFKISRSDEICDAVEKVGGQILFLDDHLDDIQLEYEDFENDSNENSSEDDMQLDSPVEQITS